MEDDVILPVHYNNYTFALYMEGYHIASVSVTKDRLKSQSLAK